MLPCTVAQYAVQRLPSCELVNMGTVHRHFHDACLHVPCTVLCNGCLRFV